MHFNATSNKTLLTPLCVKQIFVPAGRLISSNVPLREELSYASFMTCSWQLDFSDVDNKEFDN
jgi:hypothetical protein